MDIKVLLKWSFTLVLSCCITYCNAQTWTKKADLPEGREGTICFNLNGKIYWGGGTPSTIGQAKADFYEYDPATDTWAQKADMPSERAYGISFSINGKGYIGLGKTSGGGSSAYLTDMYEYDAGTDKWTKKADITTGFGLLDSRVFVINNKAYVLGGTNSNYANYGTLYEYDPANDQWTQKSTYPVTNQGNSWVRMPFVFTLNNKGYVSCGEVRKTVGIGVDYSKETYEYDPVTDKWTRKADFPGDGRLSGTAFVRDGKAYCGLGGNIDVNLMNVFYNDVYSYDAATDKWTKLTDYSGSAGVRAVSAVVNGVGYIGGGSKWQTGYNKDWYSIGTPSSVHSAKQQGSSAVIYPNPANDVLYFKSKDRYTSFRLSGITGQVISAGTLNPDNSIDISKVPAGQYILQLTADDKTSIDMVYIQ